MAASIAGVAVLSFGDNIEHKVSLSSERVVTHHVSWSIALGLKVLLDVKIDRNHVADADLIRMIPLLFVLQVPTSFLVESSSKRTMFHSIVLGEERDEGIEAAQHLGGHLLDADVVAIDLGAAETLSNLNNDGGATVGAANVVVVGHSRWKAHLVRVVDCKVGHLLLKVGVRATSTTSTTATMATSAGTTEICCLSTGATMLTNQALDHVLDVGLELLLGEGIGPVFVAASKGPAVEVGGAEAGREDVAVVATEELFPDLFLKLLASDGSPLDGHRGLVAWKVEG